MGVALFPVFDRTIPEYNPALALSGKALSKALWDKDSTTNKLCAQLGIPRLSEFYAESNAEAFAMLGEQVPASMDPNDGLQWFRPEVAHKAVTVLLQHKHIFADNESLYEDMLALQGVLEMAEKHACKFRLRMEI